MTNNSVFTTQVGGDHYRRLPVQPVQFALRHDLDACAYSILKYVSRHRSKGGVQDIQKARHFLAMRRSLAVRSGVRSLAGPVEMARYCEANGLPGDETDALIHLGDHLRGDEAAADLCDVALARLEAEYAG